MFNSIPIPIIDEARRHPKLTKPSSHGANFELGELIKSSSMSVTESGASVSDDVSDVDSLMSSITRSTEGRWVRKTRVGGR
jgi:hypothetical protein